MPVSPLQDASALLRMRLFSEGSDVSSAVSLLSATVERAMDKAATATLVFLEGDPVSQAFALSESATLWLGARITVSAGYGENDEVIFSGTVSGQRIKIAQGSPAQLVVECRDKTGTDNEVSTDATPALALTYGVDLLDFEGGFEDEVSSTGTSGLRGHMRFQGSALARPGTPIELRGLGARLDGNVLCTGLTHDLRGGNWITTVRFGAATCPSASALLEFTDENGNRIALDADGITLESPKNIRLTAGGTMTLEAVGALSVSSRADAKVSGLNIDCRAQVSFVATGSASAELSAAGQTVVKGAMVLIN